MKSIWEIPPEEVHASIIQDDEELRDIVLLEDCILTEDAREKVFDTAHPAAGYMGRPDIQREILAKESAEERRQKENDTHASAIGYLALAQ